MVINLNYTKTLREFCLNNQGNIFDVKYEQDKRFSLIPYKTLLKILNRLEEEKIVENISKGVYLVTGSDNDLDKAITDYYVNYYSGMFVGKSLYNDHDIGDSDDEKIEIYTNKVITNNKTIGKYQLIKFDTKFYDKVIGLITALELIEKVSSIKDINYIRYNEEREYGVNCYSDEVFKEIVINHHYKYSTVATLDVLLNEFDIRNNAIKIYQENYKNAF